MIGSVEILACKLTNACSHTFIQPSLLNPPGIKATCIRARHPAGTSQQTKISAQIAAALPERCRMEIQTVFTDQRTQVDVHRSTETIPTREPFFLLTPNVPE